ncbi:hypothetical protein KIN20_011129 [Parelaphostrongylus tenuis]|uniref:Uncharacterized protein n=1 Tax=Parelaphostrongylus tenuis TaxID=148309 RepID=A0AAD5M8X7_PARTN|nr:hypothetical protein KIN20_011129 [Parelaphostrongylus tenuis]
MDSCISAGAEPDPEWLTLVITLRGVTGEIFKVTALRTIDVDSVRRVDFFTEDEIMVLICYDGKNTVVEMYHLMEEDAKKWQSEVPLAACPLKYTSNSLSRKQRRKQRAARMTEA